MFSQIQLLSLAAFFTSALAADISAAAAKVAAADLASLPIVSCAAAAPAASSAAATTPDTIASNSTYVKVPGSNTLYYCSDPSDYLLSFTGVSIAPLPPMPGQNVSITVTGSLKGDIVAGTTHTVSFGKAGVDGLQPFMTTTQDLCRGLDSIPDVMVEKSNGTIKQCPIAGGPFSIHKSHQIPAIPKGLKPPPPPSGDYFLKATTTLPNGKIVACMIADLQMEGQLLSN